MRLWPIHFSTARSLNNDYQTTLDINFGPWVCPWWHESNLQISITLPTILWPRILVSRFDHPAWTEKLMAEGRYYDGTRT
jgi:hypothetical protein